VLPLHKARVTRGLFKPACNILSHIWFLHTPIERDAATVVFSLGKVVISPLFFPPKHLNPAEGGYDVNRLYHWCGAFDLDARRY